jgi:hypothetical protein
MEASIQCLQTLQGLPAYALVLGLLLACGIGAPMNEAIVLLIASALTLTGVMDPVARRWSWTRLQGSVRRAALTQEPWTPWWSALRPCT